MSRILRRHDVPRLCTLDPITGEQIRSSKQTTIRYERDRPGELVHMDVKKIGKIPDGGGWRMHGRGGHHGRSGAGYRYLHTAIDDRTRIVYSEILDDEKASTAAGFWARAAARNHHRRWSTVWCATR